METEAIMQLVLADKETRVVLAGDHMQLEPNATADFVVDADEGFFDKQLGSPTSTSSRASTPPPAVPHIMSHPTSGIHQHRPPPLIGGGTT